MATLTWDSLRAEALDGIELDPFVLVMPSGKKFEIPTLPAGVFTADFDLVQDGTLNSILIVLEQILGKKAWESLWPEISSEPVEVVSLLFDKMIQHFNAKVDSGN